MLSFWFILSVITEERMLRCTYTESDGRNISVSWVVKLLFVVCCINSVENALQAILLVPCNPIVILRITACMSRKLINACRQTFSLHSIPKQFQYPVPHTFAKGANTGLNDVWRPSSAILNPNEIVSKMQYTNCDYFFQCFGAWCFYC